MRHFDKKILANSSDHLSMFNNMWADRRAFHAQEDNLAALSNASAILPMDAWREVDARTKAITVGDEGRVWMRDLMPLSITVPIGATAFLSRTSSDISDEVIVDFGGQTAVPVDKVSYNTSGVPVPIFRKGYGREWREWSALQAANFNALMDDHEASLRKVLRKNALYVLDGDTTKQIAGYTAYGIRTSPNSTAINLGSAGGGANIDLTSATTTSDDIEAFINNTLGTVLDSNFVATGVNLYISPEIARNWDRPYSGSSGFKVGSLRDAILANRRINKIEVSFELSGNEFFGFAPSSEYIRPVIGQATSTFAMPRQYPMANYHFMIWNAMGIDIRADDNGNSGVFYSTDID